jgi:hypothetical protein
MKRRIIQTQKKSENSAMINGISHTGNYTLPPPLSKQTTVPLTPNLKFSDSVQPIISGLQMKRANS